MNFNSHTTKRKGDTLVLAGIVMLVTLFNLNAVYENNSLTFYSLAALGLCIVIYTALSHKPVLLYFLSFSIPISIAVSIGSTTTISGPSEFLCALLTLYFSFSYFNGHRIPLSFLKHPITVLLCVDLVWLLISTCLSQMPEVSLKRWLIRLVYIIIYYITFAELFMSDVKKIYKVFLFYILGLGIPVLYYLYQHQQIGFAIQGSTKFSQPFYNDHTVYGAALVFFLPFLFYFTFKQQKDPVLKLVYFLFFSLIVIAVFFSYSRAAWLSLFCAIGVYFILKWKITAKTILITLTVSGIILAFFTGSISEYFNRNKEQSHGKDVQHHFRSVTNISTDASNVERINRWKCAYRMFLDKPLLGFGPGTYQFYYGNYQIRSDFNDNSTYSGDKGHAHSEYLNYLSETGIVGLLIFIIGIGMTCKTAIRIIYHSSDTYLKNMTLVLFMGLITFYIHSFFNGFIESDKMAMPVFSSMAALAVIDLHTRNKEKVPPKK